MIHTQLNYLIAQQQIDESRRTAQRRRLGRSIQTEDDRQPRPSLTLHGRTRRLRVVRFS